MRWAMMVRTMTGQPEFHLILRPLASCSPYHPSGHFFQEHPSGIRPSRYLTFRASFLTVKLPETHTSDSCTILLLAVVSSSCAHLVGLKTHPRARIPHSHWPSKPLWSPPVGLSAFGSFAILSINHDSETSHTPPLLGVDARQL